MAREGIVYECIANVCNVNPANDSIWNTCFSYGHSSGYGHHLYVQILWTCLNEDELIKFTIYLLSQFDGKYFFYRDGA